MDQIIFMEIVHEALELLTHRLSVSEEQSVRMVLTSRDWLILYI